MKVIKSQKNQRDLMIWFKPTNPVCGVYRIPLYTAKNSELKKLRQQQDTGHGATGFILILRP